MSQLFPLTASRVRSWISANQSAVLIFCIALIARLVIFYFAWHNPAYVHQSFAADGYYEIATNLMKHGIFARNMTLPLQPDSLRTPGMPYLVMPFLYLPAGVFVFIMFQMIVSSFIPVIAQRIAQRVGLPTGWSLAVALILALDPLGISLSIRILTETFFTIFFLLFILRALSYCSTFRDRNREAFSIEKTQIRDCAIGGVFLGIATLFRSTTLYTPYLIIIGIVVLAMFHKTSTRIIMKHSAVFLLAFFLCIAPWLIRNYAVFHRAQFSSIKEEVLYSALAPSILSFRDHTEINQTQNEYFASHGDPLFPDIMIPEAARYQAYALQTIRENPKQLVMVAGVSVFTFFTHDGALDLLGILGLGGKSSEFPHFLSLISLSPKDIISTLISISMTPLSVVLFTRAVWTLIALLFFAGSIALLIKGRSYSVWLFLITIGYFALTTITNGITVNARFRYPVDALIIIVALMGLQLLHKRRSRSTVA